MNRPRHSLAMRKQAVDHLIAYCEKNVPETIIEAAQDAADFLKWAAKREIAMRELDRIERERPEVYAVLTAFPGCDVSIKEPV